MAVLAEDEDAEVSADRKLTVCRNDPINYYVHTI